MRDGIMLTVDEDGTARVYDDTYDIVIHCESQEEHDKAMEMLRGIKPNNDNRPIDDPIDTNSSRYGTDKTTDDLISRLSDLRSQYNCFDESERNAYDTLSEAIKALSAQHETHEKRTETHGVCSDVISRQDAIDATWKYPSYTAPLNVLTEVRDRIKTLPSAQPEPQWISCSERYPDMDERVLVYTVAHEYHVWDCMSNRADNYFWEDEEGLYHDKYEVDLWMPLPEPYKEVTT